MAFRIPRFDRNVPIVEENRTPTLPFHQWWDSAAKSIERSINGIQDALEAAGIALNAASVAQAAAVAAQNAADGVTTTAKLSGSGVSGATITATDAGTDVTISVTNHTRVYSDGTSALVNGPDVTGASYSTTYYVYYDDPDYDGGTVTYQISTSDATAAQTGVRHLIGSVLTPAAGQPPAPGGVVRPPGVGGIEEY